MKQFFFISSSVQSVGSLIILISCLPYFQIRAPWVKVLFAYSLGSILFHLLQVYGSTLFSLSNNSIGNGFTLFEALSFCLLYSLGVNSKSFIRFFTSLFLVYVMFYAFVFITSQSDSYSLIRVGRDFLIITYSLSYFYYLIRELPEEDLLQYPMFWINAAVIFFFSGTLILSFLRDYIVNVLKDDMAGFWAFRNFFRFAFCLILAYASWLDFKLLRQKRT